MPRRGSRPPKDTPHQLLISDATHRRLETPPKDLIALGEIEVRGRDEPIAV